MRDMTLSDQICCFKNGSFFSRQMQHLPKMLDPSQTKKDHCNVKGDTTKTKMGTNKVHTISVTVDFRVASCFTSQ